MKLYLMQHGRPVSKEEDAERPLSEKGREDAGKMGAFVHGLGIVPLDVYHSGKTRARQTAEIMVSFLGDRATIQKKGGLSPMDDVREIGNEIVGRDRDLMIVGHLPHLAKLSSLLAVGDETVPVVNFRQGGVVCLESREGGGWGVAWMVVPEMIV